MKRDITTKQDNAHLQLFQKTFILTAIYHHISCPLKMPSHINDSVKKGKLEI